MPSDYEIIPSFIRRFSSVRRYNNIPMIKDENIAEHSAQVALTCIMFYSRYIDEEAKAHIDLHKVTYVSIIHDIEEVITGDIPRSTKYSSELTQLALKSVENLAYERIEEIFGIRRVVPNPYEKSLIKLADIYLVLVKTYSELLMGNKEVSEIVDEIYYHLEKDPEITEAVEKYPKVRNELLLPLLGKCESMHNSDNFSYSKLIRR